jgi:hypothetical protein
MRMYNRAWEAQCWDMLGRRAVVQHCMCAAAGCTDVCCRMQVHCSWARHSVLVPNAVLMAAVLLSHGWV